MMVHFPIAIITIGFFADLIGVFLKKEACLTKMGYWLEFIGMIAAVLAFGTGYFFTGPLEGEAGVLRDQHELFATITLILIILGTIFRIVIRYQGKEDTWLKYLSLAVYFLAFVFVGITGHLGGTLVIDHLIGL